MALTGNVHGTQAVAAAWVNFNGTGTVAIRDSFNVTSITDNATGDYTVNLTAAMDNANYAVVCTGHQTSTDASYRNAQPSETNPPTTTAIRIYTIYVSASSNRTKSDIAYINVSVFGDQ